MKKKPSYSILISSKISVYQSILMLVLANAASTTSDELTYTEQNCLDAHNHYRAKHGVPPLEWNKTLALAAVKWADHLLHKEQNLVHDTETMLRDHQGENLGKYVTNPVIPLCRKTDDPVRYCKNCWDMVKLWYDEIKYYDFTKGDGNGKGAFLHFTQVIWKETTQLGVATVSGKQELIFVARYYLAGNFGTPKDYKRNVPPLVTTASKGPSFRYPPVGWLVAAAVIVTTLVYTISLVLVKIKQKQRD